MSAFVAFIDRNQNKDKTLFSHEVYALALPVTKVNVNTALCERSTNKRGVWFPMLRVFDVAPLAWGVNNACRGLSSSYPTSLVKASLARGTSIVCLPGIYSFDEMDDDIRSKCCVFVDSLGDVDQARANGVPLVCVRCPANDLLARLGHQSAIFGLTSEALFRFPTQTGARPGRQFGSLQLAVSHATRIMERAARNNMSSIVLLDSALGCRYKASIEVPDLVDLTNEFLFDNLAQHVVWEEGPRGGFLEKSRPLFPTVFVPRAAENLCKTAVASGVDMSKVSFMFRNNDFSTKDVIKRLLSLSSRSAFLDSSGFSSRQALELGSPSPHLSASQYFSAYVDAYGDECPDDLLEVLENYLDLQDMHEI